MRTPAIVSTENEFPIITAQAAHTISFQDVAKIVAYKVDEFTADLVCCDIVTGFDNGREVRTVHEETPGFDSLMARFASLPGFNLDWREEVVLPPFAANRTTIYKRP